MVDKLTEFEGYYAATEMTVTEDNIFCLNGYFSEAGMMESMAQTCAAVLDTKALTIFPLSSGIIGAVKDFNLIFQTCSGRSPGNRDIDEARGVQCDFH